MSLIGKAVKLETDLQFHFFCLHSTSPLDCNLFTMSCRGNDIQMFPEGILLFLLSILDFVRIVPLFEANLLMSVPRNLAFSVLVFVIRVFSSDRVNLSPFRNSFIATFKCTADFLLPHIPIIQSSAYLTYLNIGCTPGLGMLEFNFLCTFTVSLIDFFI